MAKMAGRKENFPIPLPDATWGTKHRCTLNNTMKIAARSLFSKFTKKTNLFTAQKKKKLWEQLNKESSEDSQENSTVVGGTWKSVHYMRALAVSFSDPRTEKQKNQRSKFTAAVNFTKAMTPFLRFWIQSFRTAISIQCCSIVYSETCNER